MWYMYMVTAHNKDKELKSNQELTRTIQKLKESYTSIIKIKHQVYDTAVKLKYTFM